MQFISRSSRPEVFCKKGVLRNFEKFAGKRLCQGLFCNNEVFMVGYFFSIAAVLNYITAEYRILKIN